MPKLILEKDDGTRDEYTTFFAVLAVDTGTGKGGIFHEVIGMDCRTLVAGAMLRKAMACSWDSWNDFIRISFDTPPLAQPDIEALEKRIKWSKS